MIEENNLNQEQNFTTSGEKIIIEPNLSASAVDYPHVDVDVKPLGDRQRQITAKIQLPSEIEKVWKILTDYEALSDFIPNLAKSRLLKHPSSGIRLEQVGTQKFLGFNFCARVVLDLIEHFPKEISFRMVEGDFKDFYGSWLLEPYGQGEQQGTNLFYTIFIWPKLTMPVGIIERRLSQDLQANLIAIHQKLAQIP